MRSSASTLNPPSRGPRLWVVLVGDDHPRACTGRRLLRLGFAKPLPVGRPTRGIVLDPYAPVPLCRADRPAASRGGVTAVDCSWNRLSADRASGRESRRAEGSLRRLPMLIATNPQHFGRFGELNTAEALGAAAFVLGFPARAKALLSGFAGGTSFLDMNRERLSRYASADRPEDVLAAERELLGGLPELGPPAQPIGVGAPGSRTS